MDGEVQYAAVLLASHIEYLREHGYDIISHHDSVTGRLVSFYPESKHVMRVFLRQDDIDRHGEGCDCGLCNSNGKSIGIGIYDIEHPDEVVERVYAPSEDAAEHNAKLVCAGKGYEVADNPEES